MSDNSLSLPLDTFAVGVLAGFLLVATVDELLVSVPVVRTALAVVLVGIVPGALFVTLLGVEPAVTARWTLYTVTCSLMLVMGMGLVFNLVLPLVGYREPLGPGPMVLGLALVVGELIYLNVYRDVATGGRERLVVSVDLERLAVPASLLLPLAAVVGVTLLNTTGTNALVVLVLVVIAVVPVAVSIGHGYERYLPFVLYCLGLAVLYHSSLWRGYVYGGHPYVVDIWETLQFSPTNVELLANAVLWPATARLGGIGPITQLTVVNPLFVALVPVALFSAFRRYLGPRRAFLGASLFVFAHPFYNLYPTAGRVATPVFFLAVLGLVVGDEALSVLQRRVLSVVAATGIIVSHYGTSYYVMYAIVLSLALLVALRLADWTLERVVSGATPNGGTTRAALGSSLRAPIDAATVLTLPFAAFYVVAVVGWYMHTGGGRRFDGLVSNVRQTYTSLMTPGTRGSTATRLVTDYGTTSIRLSKLLYVAVGLLVVGGLAATYYRRLHPDWTQPVDDEYLVLGTALLGLFGSTFVVSGQWGGGRPMMIVFSMTALYAVVGTEVLGATLTRVAGGRDRSVATGIRRAATTGRRALDDQLERWRRPGSTTARLVARAATTADDVGGRLAQRVRPVLAGADVGRHTPFAVLLVALVLLNTGVAALAIGGFAPSNVPLQNELEESPSPNHQSKQYVTEDIRTHAWLADHRDPSLAVYGDRLARAQTTDRYNGEIGVHSDRPPYRFKKRNHLDSALPVLEPGYVVLLGHNVEHGTVAINYVEYRDLESLELDLEDRAKVYANDHGAVYYDAGDD